MVNVVFTYDNKAMNAAMKLIYKGNYSIGNSVTRFALNSIPNGIIRAIMSSILLNE